MNPIHPNRSQEQQRKNQGARQKKKQWHLSTTLLQPSPTLRSQTTPWKAHQQSDPPRNLTGDEGELPSPSIEQQHLLPLEPVYAASFSPKAYDRLQDKLTSND